MIKLTRFQLLHSGAMQCDNTAAAAASAAAAGVELNLRSDVIHCLHILFFCSTPFLPFPLAVFASSSSSSYSASASGIH